MAGVDIVHVPYRGSSGARTDTIGGQVQMMFDAVTTLSEHVKAGQVRALGTSGKTRSTVLPDVPTVAETAVPNFEVTGWFGMLAPATPAPIVARLNKEVNAALSQSTSRSGSPRSGRAGGGSPEDFAKLIEADSTRYGDAIKRLAIKAD